jgi:hypothetical protein
VCASRSSVRSDGSAAPRSNREIVSVSTPTSSASSACVQLTDFGCATRLAPSRCASAGRALASNGHNCCPLDQQLWLTSPGLTNYTTTRVLRMPDTTLHRQPPRNSCMVVLPSRER